jgi:PTH1 family peptidyl-tRNA hydrolase
VVVGLGNPGQEFVGTRHNVGADVVALLAARHGGQLKAEKGQQARLTQVKIDGATVALAVPTTYMNESGAAVRPLLRRFGITAPEDLVIVHDELDLEPGTVRVKQGGGTAGHNGLKSIQSHVHSPDFVRIRVGIGKPPGRREGADHVLSRPPRAERELLEVAVVAAADAVELIARDGVDEAMNLLNGR